MVVEGVYIGVRDMRFVISPSISPKSDNESDSEMTSSRSDPYVTKAGSSLGQGPFLCAVYTAPRTMGPGCYCDTGNRTTFRRGNLSRVTGTSCKSPKGNWERACR
ncbi:hypothetical protein KIL84_008677 [Mauremys mutica]|uniref:Uncharacterized protein n=1 Tax=Mauremys mutica TaxID=74926 RepID=A0A9D3X864_9SAUR|nr:hypothetical protein KIL84_008677 [Mauremys mutica]